MEATENISSLHTEHLTWLGELSAHKEELAKCTRRLGDISSFGLSRDTAAQVEHFQNQFIRQREVMDELRHDIKQHENELARQKDSDPSDSLMDDHDRLREQFDIFNKIFNEVVNEFADFSGVTA